MKVVLSILLCFMLFGCEPSHDVAQYQHEEPVYYRISSVFTSQGSGDFPDSLANPHPNPYNHQAGDTSIFISFTLRDSADTKLIIQNPIGDSVAVFFDDVLAPGVHSGWWTPLNTSNKPLRAGLYFITLRVEPNGDNYIDSKLLYIENND